VNRRGRSGGAVDLIALCLASAAAILGLLYATVSAYWVLGGRVLLDTLGGSLERQARAGTSAAVVAGSFAVVLKVLAGGLPLAVVLGSASLLRGRAIRWLAWICSLALTGYGLVLTTAGLLVQASVIGISRTAERRALQWHAYLWDPWFLIWGAFATLALMRARTPRPVDIGLTDSGQQWGSGRGSGQRQTGSNL
jgi:hypothetical protein